MSARRRVLVTGAQGFIGRYCLPRLARRDFEVIGLAQPGRPTPLPPGAHDWQEADILDPVAVDSLMEAVRPSHLLHLAWFTKRGAFWQAAENLRWVGASLRLFLATRSIDCKRMLAVGTGAEYGPATEPCSENDTPCAPAGLYGICKDAVRRCLLAASEDGKPGVVWARLFFPYGPHDNPDKLIPYVIRSLLQGEEAECSDGKQVRDLLYVEDVADALVATLDSEVRGAVNISSGVGVELRSVISKIGELAERPDLIRLGARPPSPHDAPVWVADVTRLRDEVGWRPSTSLEEGLRRTIAWHRQGAR